MRKAQYEPLAEQNRQRKLEQWRSTARELENDPAAIAHYLLRDEDIRVRTIPNLVTKSAASPATLAAGMQTLPMDDGLCRIGRISFAWRPNELEIAGQFKSVTLLAWVRVDGLKNAYQALISPDGLSNGTMRWGLTERGEIRLGVARESGKEEPLWDTAVSKPVLTSQNFGTWILLATTYEDRTVRHYLNGRLVSSALIYDPNFVRIGAAEVGNWRGATPRFFTGGMDELAILSRAMSETELKAVYKGGRPLSP